MSLFIFIGNFCLHRKFVNYFILSLFVKNVKMLNSENPFKSTPSSSSMENQFRMAQVLQAKKDYDFAIRKYIDLLLSVEKTIALNPGANVELQWPVLSLGNIADIYAEKQDYNKALLFRNSQNEFLLFMKEKKISMQSNSESDSDDNDTDFFEVATTGHKYQSLFKKVHEAIDAPEMKPRESPEELAKRIIEAKQKEEEEKMEEIIRQLNEASQQREKEIQNSFIKRNVRRMTDHPVIFVLLLLACTLLAVLWVQFKPKRKTNIPGGLEGSMAYLQKYMDDYEKKNGIKHDAHHHHHSHDNGAEKIIRERMKAAEKNLNHEL